MYQIKHVINYDKEALDQELERDTERFYQDKRIPRLLRRATSLRILRGAVSMIGLCCSCVALTLALFSQYVWLPRILALVGLGLSSLSLLVLSSAVPKALRANAEKLKTILDSYGDTPAMRYHMFVTHNGMDKVEIWGAETDDSKFEITLSAEVNGKVHKETFLCQFDGQSKGGVLVLDIRNCVVLRANEAQLH